MLGKSHLKFPVKVSLGTPVLSSFQQCLPNEMNRSEQHLDGSCRNIAILDSMKPLLGSILLKCTSELVNKSVLTILVAVTSKITESSANMFETCIVCTSRNGMSHTM